MHFPALLRPDDAPLRHDLKLDHPRLGSLAVKFSGPKRATDDADQAENVAPLGVRWNGLLYGLLEGRIDNASNPTLSNYASPLMHGKRLARIKSTFISFWCQ